jgi:hypothetical protein
MTRGQYLFGLLVYAGSGQKHCVGPVGNKYRAFWVLIFAVSMGYEERCPNFPTRSFQGKAQEARGANIAINGKDASQWQ